MNTFYILSAVKPSGETISFDQFRGKVVLVVNTASRCGFTPQYEGLQELYDRYKDQGFVVLAFPCDQFAHQEPLSNEEIQESCKINYGVNFPVFEKCQVNGEQAHPVFKYLRTELRGLITNSIKWNFTKFLIDSDGVPVRRFAPTTSPELLVDYIEELLPSNR